MNTSYDLLSPSPPVSPSRTKDVATPTQGRKLKRLSLVSGAVFSTDAVPLETSVKEAMLDNPSFASPTRSSFETPAKTAEPTTPTSRDRITPRTRAASILDTTKHARTPTVRLGYKHPPVGERKTPQARARRSSSRERLEPAFEQDAARTSQDSGRSNLAPRPTSLPNPSPDLPKRPTGPLTLIEKHADLLAYIAQKEREVADAKRTYDRKLAELEEVKKRWEVITARQGFHSTTTPGKGKQLAPVPVRRTASSSSTGSVAEGPAAGQPDLTTTAVEGSRRLFGHLMDSLSGITNDLALGGAEDEPSTQDGETSDRKKEKAQMKRLIAGSGRDSRDGRRPSDASTAASDLAQDVASSSSAVDFTNIWDGLAPQAKDWKEKLGNVMGVSAPTLITSQKKASDFLSTNLTHTLDFFAQALPTPNLGTSPTPSSDGKRPQRRPLTRGTSGSSVPEDEGEADSQVIPWNW